MEIKNFGGKVIKEPGIYKNIPIETYHNNPFLLDGFSISSSALRDFIQRPSLYWANSVYNSKRKVDDKPRPHFTFGKAAHHLLLGEKGFKEHFALRPDTYPDNPDKPWHGSSKSCKAWIEAQAGKDIITSEEINHIRGIKESLSNHPIVQGGILNGMVEQSMFIKVGNIWLRARPDVIPPSSGDFADLKTTTAISYADCEKAIYNRGYHIQAALVRMLARALMGEGFEFGGFALVFVEKTPPYDVEILQLEDQALDLGERQINLALKYLEICIDTGVWPGEGGFSPTIRPVGIPPWGVTRIENEMQYIENELESIGRELESQ